MFTHSWKLLPAVLPSPIFKKQLLCRFFSFRFFHISSANETLCIAVVGRGLLDQKVARNPFSLYPSREHLVCGLFKRHIAILLPKKVPKQKTCQILKKWVICDYLLLNYITGKKCKILCSTKTKTTCIIRKSTKNCI